MEVHKLQWATMPSLFAPLRLSSQALNKDLIKATEHMKRDRRNTGKNNKKSTN